MGINGVGYTVLYDGECRICAAFARVLKALDLRGHVLARKIQDSPELLGTLTPSELLVAMHAVGPEGRVSTGGEAIPAILAAVAGGPSMESLLRSSRSVMAGLDRLYRVIAAIRGRLTCGIAAPSSASGPLP